MCGVDNGGEGTPLPYPAYTSSRTSSEGMTEPEHGTLPSSNFSEGTTGGQTGYGPMEKNHYDPTCVIPSTFIWTHAHTRDVSHPHSRLPNFGRVWWVSQAMNPGEKNPKRYRADMRTPQQQSYENNEQCIQGNGIKNCQPT